MEEAINKDQANYPHCYYSRKSSTSIIRDAITGQSKCEDVQIAYRQCPRESPVQIYSNTSTTSKDSQTSERQTSESEQQKRRGRHFQVPMLPDEFKKQMDEMEGMLGQLGGLFGGFGLGSGRPPVAQIPRQTQMRPPHKGGSGGDRSFHEYDGVSEEV